MFIGRYLFEQLNMAWTLLLGHLLLLAGCFSATHQACADLDTTACQLMTVHSPNLCSNPTLSLQACPKFCNLCNTSLECYHCNSTVDDNHLCTTTKTCAAGEVCMKKSVTSVVDGHHEYQLSCESKNHCDGKDLTLSFGKRGLDVRDVSISCCYNNLCNSITAVAPPSHTTTPPTTTPCVSPWVQFDRHCYYVDSTKRSFAASSSFCQSLGAETTDIMNDHENAFVRQLAAAANLLSPGYAVWIGLGSYHTAIQPTWNNGKELVYTHFSVGEPNNKGDNEDCIEMGHDGGWNDKPCTIKWPVVCKK